jgi:hypothetical protein
MPARPLFGDATVMKYSTHNSHRPDACAPACVEPDSLLALLWRLERELDVAPIRVARCVYRACALPSPHATSQTL